MHTSRKYVTKSVCLQDVFRVCDLPHCAGAVTGNRAVDMDIVTLLQNTHLNEPYTRVRVAVTENRAVGRDMVTLL